MIQYDIETLDGDIGLECVCPATLRALCMAMGLSAKGTREQLVERLRKAYKELGA